MQDTLTPDGMTGLFGAEPVGEFVLWFKPNSGGWVVRTRRTNTERLIEVVKVEMTK